MFRAIGHLTRLNENRKEPPRQAKPPLSGFVERQLQFIDSPYHSPAGLMGRKFFFIISFFFFLNANVLWAFENACAERSGKKAVRLAFEESTDPVNYKTWSAGVSKFLKLICKTRAQCAMNTHTVEKFQRDENTITKLPSPPLQKFHAQNMSQFRTKKMVRVPFHFLDLK